MAVVALTVLFLLACMSSPSEAKKKRSSCTMVNITLCQGLRYKWTTFPNPITQIENQKITSKLTKLYPELARFNCTKVDAVPFLCSVYVPKCYPKMPNNVILPCRGFCQQAVGHCPSRITKLGVQWPESLNCSRYPVAGEDTKCINDSKFTIIKGRRKNTKKTKGKKNDTCCRQGIKAARRRYKCSLTSNPSTGNPLVAASASQAEQAFVKRVLRQCQTKEANFKSCCFKEMEKIKKREDKKKRREERQKNKESQRKIKQEKRQEKLKRKKSRKANKKTKKTQRKKTSG